MNYLGTGPDTNYQEITFRAVAALSDKTDKPRDLINDYMHLTKTVLPSMARSGECDWPVREDHCFQRIILDTICGGVWYDHLQRPADKHLTNNQPQRAVELCQDIVEGKPTSKS